MNAGLTSYSSIAGRLFTSAMYFLCSADDHTNNAVLELTRFWHDFLVFFKRREVRNA